MAADKENSTTWSNKMDFIMAAISAAIGLGNLWRFPYQCYNNGGGAFLVPFLLMVVLVGFPQMLADMSLGQYSRSGAVRAYRAVPLMLGLGWQLVMLSMHVDVYYAVIISYTLFYMFASFTKQLPWVNCGNWWNTDACTDSSISLLKANCTEQNGTWIQSTCELSDRLVADVLNTSLPNDTALRPIDASEEYFHNYVLQLSPGITELGIPRWPIVLCVLFLIIIVLFSLILGVKTWGKLAYVFALVPYVVLVAILVQSLLREGSLDGIIYFLKPRWSKLAEPKVWVDAVGQVYFSLGCAGGALINIGSFNRFKNNCVTDAIIVTISDTLTSLLCGVVVFSILGLMAHDTGLSIDEVVGKGAGMTFVVYSSALSQLPSAPIWSSIFMFMMVNLGVGSLVAIVATVQKVFVEELPASLQKQKLYSNLILLTVLLIMFLLGLVYMTNGGMYVLQMMDSQVSYLMIVIGLCKIITVTWLYGVNRLYDDIQMMGGTRPHQLLAWTHKFISPALLVAVFIFNFTQLKPLMYRDYVFPPWATYVGLAITFLSFLLLPGVAIYKIVTLPGGLPLNKRIRRLCQPAADWGSHVDNSEECKDLMEKDRAKAPAETEAYV